MARRRRPPRPAEACAWSSAIVSSNEPREGKRGREGEGEAQARIAPPCAMALRLAPPDRGDSGDGNDVWDLVVVGTGLPESVVAAAAAKRGKTCLQIEAGDTYGGRWATRTLRDVLSEGPSDDGSSRSDPHDPSDAPESGSRYARPLRVEAAPLPRLRSVWRRASESGGVFEEGDNVYVSARDGFVPHPCFHSAHNFVLTRVA